MEEQNKNQEPTSKDQPQGCFQGVTLIACCYDNSCLRGFISNM